jgi:hypothetical protein
VKIHYDYSKDIMAIDGSEYPLSPYRKWLFKNHESLCNGHFIKALKVLGKTKFYFDWQSIYLKASEYQFLNNYINELSTDPTRKP